MTRQRFLSTLTSTGMFTLLLLVAMFGLNADTTSALQVKTTSENQKETPKPVAADDGSLAAQVKELQKQVTDLKARVSEMQSPRIVAAGTATFKLGAVQDNATNARVQLNADITAKLGDDYIVLLTNRFPTGGYPFFEAYWKRAKDGFDITLVDVTLGPDSTATYAFNKNKTYLIDWIVVKK